MTDYALLDCGNGRRLERLGGVTVSRPAPGATGKRGLPDAAWNAAHLTFTRGTSRGTGWRGEAPNDWRVRLGGVTMALRPAAAGQIGVFPEHAAVAEKILSRIAKSENAPLRVLNLFAHTGLATLMLASKGCTAAHVDGSAAAVKQARENAALSALADKPVRWLTDDALAFMRREVRREKKYDILLADPPAFGRGGSNGGKKLGEWKLERDLPELLELADKLLERNALLALTCHSEGWEDGRLSEAVRANKHFKNIKEEKLTLTPETKSGAPLPGGHLLLAEAFA